MVYWPDKEVAIWLNLQIGRVFVFTFVSFVIWLGGVIVSTLDS